MLYHLVKFGVLKGSSKSINSKAIPHFFTLLYIFKKTVLIDEMGITNKSNTSFITLITLMNNLF